MILLTGGAGFIGSVLLKYLNDSGRTDIFLVDSLGTSEKWKNISKRQIDDYLDKNAFLKILRKRKSLPEFDFIFHLGACSSTTERNMDYLMENNFLFSKYLAEHAFRKKTPFIYASSGATYGDGANGFQDDTSLIHKLSPLNGYGFTKHIFDSWIIKQKTESQILGFKFFNVFGPNEYHKGEMSSVVFKAYHEVLTNKKISLFASEHPEYQNGEQKRDFIYVKDVVETLLETTHKGVSGLFNLGSGTPNTWNDLASAIFKSLKIKENIEYVPLPSHLVGKYQYYTAAEMDKLYKTGITHRPRTLDISVNDYISNYLTKDDSYL
ncbi:MAG TPA: ADP-glyceromanno-heptose 6-epimerase [Oligoflexia bacterium]|nr:ADP-glyceromanno-heptose 6-epimerase [Oligoflexia bacterium]HMP49553.1 ADP-glyceromanno-heptose 6-epimerase [Oligoflexia bacterium]